MHIKGQSVGNAGAVAQHIGHGEENEQIEVKELRGVSGMNVAEALAEMEAMASIHPTKKPLYHGKISPEPGQPMTPERWQEAIDALEKKLGLEGQPRVVVHHTKKDREHAHVVWLRVDLDRNRVISDSYNYRKHEEVARDLERRFGHNRIQGAHAERDGQPRPERRPYDYQTQRGERTGLSPDEAKAWVQTLWKATDSGKAFKAALESQGWKLAHGRRGYVAVDPYGSVNTIGRLTGEKAVDVRARLGSIPLESLPTAEQAQKQQRAMHADRAAGPEPERKPAPEPTPRDPVQAAQQAEARRQSQIEKERHRQEQQRATADARAAEREKARQEFSARMQAARPQTRVESIIQQGMDTNPASGAKAMEFGGRFTVARATAADIERLRGEQAERAMSNGWAAQRAEGGKDWKPQQMQEGDFFAVSSTGRAYRLNPHRVDYKALEARHAAEGKAIGSVADARLEMMVKGVIRQAERAERRVKWEQAQADRNSGFGQFHSGAADAGKDAAFTVRDVAANTTQRLGGFVAGLLGAFLGGGSIKASYSTESPTERAAAYKAQRLSRDALRSIRDSIDRDEPLKADDVRNLSPEILENIRARGDAALLDQIRRMEEDRTRDHERGRTREL